MMALIRRLAADCRASSATEMALVLPLMLLLIFSTFEVGNFFLSEHVVQKGVRDAARYASRLSISNYTGCAVGATAEEQIQRVARAGDPDGDPDDDGDADSRLMGWDSDDMTSVDISCDTSGTYAGIYTVYPFPDGVPVVTVTAAVPYPSLFSRVGLYDLSLTLHAGSEAAVFAQ